VNKAGHLNAVNARDSTCIAHLFRLLQDGKRSELGRLLRELRDEDDRRGSRRMPLPARRFAQRLETATPEQRFVLQDVILGSGLPPLRLDEHGADSLTRIRQLLPLVGIGANGLAPLDVRVAPGARSGTAPANGAGTASGTASSTASSTASGTGSDTDSDLGEAEQR
jgi:hypothetical protein